VKQAKQEKSNSKHHSLAVGDTVFIQRPPGHLQEDIGVSRRLLPRADERLCQIHKIHKFISAQTVLLEDPDTGSTYIGIAQPVSIARVIPFNMGNLESPVDSTQRLFLQIRVGDEWGTAAITRQSATCAVRSRYGDGTERLTHLETEEYQWTGQP
jgi:hypothetical protein